MKNKFARINKPQAEISTAALPDIIFILLFFFMVTTVLRKTENKVVTQLPTAEQLQKHDKDPLILEIKIGPAKNQTRMGEGSYIQINDRLVSMEEVPHLVMQQKATIPEYLKDQMIISFRIDENTNMGIVVDLQQKLRKINARKIIYNTIKENNRS